MNDTVHRLRHRLVQSLGVVVDRDPSGETVACPAAPIASAAAVLTCHQRDDGHIHITSAVIADAVGPQLPLSWLVEQALLPGATTLVSGGDRQALATAAARQRSFVEPRLASIVLGSASVREPAELLTPAWRHEPAVPYTAGAEAELYATLQIPNAVPFEFASDDGGPATAAGPSSPSSRALAIAASRLMLWFHAAAFADAEPGEFSEPMLALRHWFAEQVTADPDLARLAASGPIRTAVSLQDDYRDDLQRRLAGEPRGWPGFVAGLTA